MKNLIKFLFLFGFAVLLISCGDKKNEPKNEEEYLNSAKQLYDSALAKNDKGMFAQSIDRYKEFIAKYPKSEKVVSAYTEIAKIYFDNLQNYPEAINTYKAVFEKFPDKKEAKQSLFMIAFIYDEAMKDKENAKASYRLFLDKYPTDTDANEKMSESARRMLEVLESGKTIEELIMQNNPETSKETKKTEEVKQPNKPTKEELRKEEISRQKDVKSIPENQREEKEIKK